MHLVHAPIGDIGGQLGDVVERATRGGERRADYPARPRHTDRGCRVVLPGSLVEVEAVAVID
jgi:hypothetical protein